MLHDPFPSRLHDALAAVCPVAGVSIGDRADRSTWRVSYAPEATAAQIAAAQAVLAAFDPAAPTAADVRAEEQRRIMRLLGARDAAHMGEIIADGTREAVRLLRIGEERDWTTEEEQRAAALQAVDTAMTAIRAAAAAMATNPPADYADDARWTP
jgi:hypothetical protein